LNTPNTSISERKGRANTQFLGLDVHLPVFLISSGLAVIFSVLVLSYPEISYEILTNTQNFVVVWFGTLFTVSMSVFTLIIFFLIISPFGKIKLGGKNSVPEFGFLTWVCMLFAAGVGIGMTFYGAAEPLSYYTGVFGTPLNASPESEEAYRLAFSATIFHWGLNAWSVYAIIGLSLAFFCYNWKLPLTIRSIFYPLLGNRIWGWQGDIIDIIAVLATLFGLTTSLGLGARQAASGLFYLFDVPNNLLTQSLIIIFITSVVIFSVYRGLNKGVKVLSNINIGLALVLLAFVVLAGPTFKIIMAYGENLISYFQDIVRLSNWNRPDDLQWYHDWTIFYWAWWLALGPQVGLFVTRVSKGRSLRQLITGMIFFGSLGCFLFYMILGNYAINLELSGQLAVSEMLVNEGHRITATKVLLTLPFGSFFLFAYCLMVVIFIATSYDSVSYVIAYHVKRTSSEMNEPDRKMRLFWAFVLAILPAALFIIDLNRVAMDVILLMSLPLLFICPVLAVSLVRTLKNHYSENNQ